MCFLQKYRVYSLCLSCIHTLLRKSMNKLSGTESDFYSDLDILFTTSISILPVIILGDFNIHYNNVHKSIKLCQLLDSFDMNQ